MLANGLVIFTGLFLTFILPMFISIEQYGYFKLFGFYLSLVGIAHFGFNDGILLKYGHYNYKDIPFSKFRSFFWFLFYFQLFIVVIILVFVLFLKIPEERKVIISITCINLILLNLTTFFVFICQITKRFNQFSKNTILQNVIIIIGVVSFVWLDKTTYFPYIMLQTIVNLIILLKYVYEMRKLVFGERKSFRVIKKDIKLLYKTGFFILVGNFMGILIIGIDRIFIDATLNIKQFSYYSFAISLLGLIFTFITAISTYIYPFLARKREQIDGVFYDNFSLICIITSGYSLVSFFFLKYFIIEYLDSYKNALFVAMVLYPTIVFRSVINIIGVNFYKALGDVRSFNKNNIFALLFTLIINLAITFFVPSLNNYAIGSSVCFYLWYLYTDYYFYRKFNTKPLRNNLIIIFTTIIFFISSFLPMLLDSIIYLTSLTIMLGIICKKDLYKLKFSKNQNRKGS